LAQVVTPVSADPNSTTLTPSITSSWTPTTIASVTTILGTVETIFITPTAPPAATETVNEIVGAPGDQFFNNTARVAGTFTGVAIAIVLLFLLVFFIARRFSRRAKRPGSVSDVLINDSNPPGRPPGWVSRYLPPIVTKNLGTGHPEVSEKSPDSDSRTPATLHPLASRRASGLLSVQDERLDPIAVMSQQNGSQASFTSFKDNKDYSRRMLKVSKPSPSELTHSEAAAADLIGPLACR
jgi:hypothetical protein